MISEWSSNNTQHPWKQRNVESFNDCLVKKFDGDQTSLNETQHTTKQYSARPNEVVKRPELSALNKSCALLVKCLVRLTRPKFEWNINKD